MPCVAQWRILTLGIAATLGMGVAFAQSNASGVDPELQAGLTLGPPTALLHPPTIAQYQATKGPLRYEERTIPGIYGEPPVHVIILEPKKAKPNRGGLLEIHGGGYVGGSATQDIFFTAPLAKKLGVTVVSVEYRLAPGTRYPGSLYDNYAALKWFYENANRMGVDAKRIAIVGGSAGGGHAAELSIFARDKQEVPIYFQVLLAPMLDDRTGGSSDPGTPFGRVVWTREQNRAGWKALLGVDPGGKEVPVEAVPARAEDLSRLPPTFISVGALDLFAAEDIAFAQRLMKAGVRTELHVYPGAFHGFEFIVPNARISREARAALESALARAFESIK